VLSDSIEVEYLPACQSQTLIMDLINLYDALWPALPLTLYIKQNIPPSVVQGLLNFHVSCQRLNKGTVSHARD
jgi:hypothetical protein